MRPSSVVRKPLTLGNTSALLLAYGIGSGAFMCLLDPMFGWIGAAFASGLAVWAWTIRASDIIFDSRGLTVVGRSLERRAMRWDEIQSSDVHDAGEAMRVGSSPVRRYYLRVTTEPKIVLLAEGLGEDERAELQVIADCITEATKSTDSAMTAPSGPASSLVCSNCGATVAPAEQAAVRCGACGHDVVIPTEIQNLVRNARAIAEDRRSEERELASVLDQPGALGVVMVQSAIFGLGMACLAAWLSKRVPFGVGALLFLSAVAVFIVERRTMANRRAVRSIGRYFGAIAPARKGAPATCRSCGGPLPVTDGTAVVACVFCHSSNLLNVDLRNAAMRASEVRGDLEMVLPLRQRQRNLALGFGITGLAVSALFLEIMSLRPH